MMGWEIHPAKTAFAKFSADWDRLNLRLHNGHPFFDSRFVGLLLDHFGNGGERLCIHRRENGISGALILCSSRLGCWSSFRPSQVQATPVLLEDACLIETLFAALPRAAWTIELYAVDPRYAPDFSSLTLPQIVQAQAHTIGVRPEHEFSDYWKERPKKLTANVGRYFRRAEAEFGTLSFATLAKASDMETGVDRYGALETAGWKGQMGTAISGDNPQGTFYSEVLRRFASTNQAAVYELHIGSHLASSRLVISNDDMLICLKTTYDESLARFAPGRLLLYRVIEAQFALPARKTIEFYTNATSDQKEWSTFGCTLRNIQVFKKPLYAGVFSLLRAFRQGIRNISRRSSENEPQLAKVKYCKSIEEFKGEQYELREFTIDGPLETSVNWFELLQQNVYPNDPGVRYYFTTEKKFPQVIVPVRLTKSGLIKSIESLSNYYTSLYTPLVSQHGDMLDLQDLLSAAARSHRGAQVMRFSPLDPDSPAYQALLGALRANDWIPFRFFCFGNWRIKVDGSWKNYLRTRSANLRSSISRRSRRFAAEGGTVEIVRTTEYIEKAIADFQEIYAASWKRPEPYPDFVPSLIRYLAARGALRLGIARLKGRTIAAQLWIVAGKKASIYKVAYHDAFASYSPGTVVMARLMQYVIEEDHVREVDFLIGDDKYKRMWMNDRRERWGIVAYNPRTVIGFALLVQEIAGRLWKLVAGRIRCALSGRSPTCQREAKTAKANVDQRFPHSSKKP